MLFIFEELIWVLTNILIVKDLQIRNVFFYLCMVAKLLGDCIVLEVQIGQSG